VLLFKRILNFSGLGGWANDKRKAQRYAVGHPFPFKTVLTLIGQDGEGRTVQDDQEGVDWAGRLVNLSASGAGIQLHSAAPGSRGGRCRLKFSHADYLLTIPGTIAYSRAYPQYMLCGFSFTFSDFETRRAYLQLLEPVSIAASLAPVDAKKVKQDAEGLHKEQYKSPTAASLTVWRHTRGGPVHKFDFCMNDYGVHWLERTDGVESYGVPPGAVNRSAPTSFVKLTETQQNEVRRLFRLAVPNLSKAVPSDLRKLLARLAV
jgi:hypothetical protein